MIKVECQSATFPAEYVPLCLNFYLCRSVLLMLLNSFSFVLVFEWKQEETQCVIRVWIHSFHSGFKELLNEQHLFTAAEAILNISSNYYELLYNPIIFRFLMLKESGNLPDLRRNDVIVVAWMIINLIKKQHILLFNVCLKYF